MSIVSLHSLIPPPTNQVNGRISSWSDIEMALGTPLPSDYRELVDSYGAGYFGEFFWVFVPECPSPHLDLLRQSCEQLRALRELRSNSGHNVPYPIFPDDGGVLPLGVTDNGDVLYWVTRGEPDHWVVAVNQSRGPEWYEFPGGATEFLERVLSGKLQVPIFPDDLGTVASGVEGFAPLTL